MADFILDLFELSAVMAAAVIVLLLLRKPIGSRFSAWSRYLVWTLVVIRLCVPVGAGLAEPVFTVTLPEKVTADVEASEMTQADIQSPSAVQTEKTEQTLPPETGALTEAVTQSTSLAVTISPSVVMPAESEAVRPQVTLPSVKEPTLESEKTPVEIDTRRVLSVIGYLWLAGAIAYFAFRMGAYTLFTLRMKRELRSADGRVLRIYETLCTRLNIKRVPRLFVSRVPVSPMLYGYIRARIVIPDLEFADEEKICQMLIHELTHHRRGDVYVKLLCTAAIAVHWFNPAAHVAASRCVSAMELACDEAVVRTMNESSRARYGETLLEIVRRCADVRTSSMTTGMNSRRSNVKERIMNILDTNKKKRGITIVAAVLCICMIAGGVVGCAVGDNAEKPDTPVTDNATYYVPEYMKIVDLNDTYEAKLSFEGDTLVAERTKNGEADVTYTALYDGERLTSVDVRNAEGELIRTKSFTYDENGNVTLISYTSADNSREYSRTEYAYGDGHLWSITYTEDDEPGDIRYSYIYEDGRVTHCYHAYGIENFLNVNIQYSYDDMGRLAVNETEYSDNGITTVIRSTNEYDADGRISRCVTVIDGGGMSEPEPYHTDTFTYDKFGNVQTLTRESGTVMDNDNVPDITKVTNIYTEDGRHLVSQSAAGNSPRPTSEVAPYKGKFDAEKLESSGFILQGTQLKWRECNKAEYLRYRAVYETVDTLSEEEERGYLLDADNHMWCFDDIVTDMVEKKQPYEVFEGSDPLAEAEARERWYEANLDKRESSTISYETLKLSLEAFLMGDYEVFANLQEGTPAANLAYQGLKLGGYKLSLNTTDDGVGVMLDFEVLESENDILTPGYHRFLTYWHLGTYLVHVDNNETVPKEYYDHEYHDPIHLALLRKLYEFDEEMLASEEVNMAFTGFVRVYAANWLVENYPELSEERFTNSGSWKLTVDELKDYVKRYYGFEDYEPITDRDIPRQYGYTYRDGYIEHVGILGSTVIPHTIDHEQINDDGSVTVTVTHWADMTRTVVGKRSKYTFITAEDGTTVLKNAELVYDSGITPAYGNST